MSSTYHAIGLAGQFMTIDTVKNVLFASKNHMKAILDYASFDVINKYYSVVYDTPLAETFITEVIHSGGYLVFALRRLRCFYGRDMFDYYHVYTDDDKKITRMPVKDIPKRYAIYVNGQTFIKQHGHIFVDYYDKTYKVCGEKYRKGMDLTALLKKKIEKKGNILSCMIKASNAGLFTSEMLHVFYDNPRIITAQEGRDLFKRVDMFMDGKHTKTFMIWAKVIADDDGYADVSGSFESLAKYFSGKIGACRFHVNGIRDASLSVAAVHYNRLCREGLDVNDDVKWLSRHATFNDMIQAVNDIKTVRDKYPVK